jgi:hypothetical protein
MVTHTEMRTEVTKYFRANFTGLPEARIDFPNENFTTPVGQTWARFSIVNVTSVQRSLGDVGRRKYDRGASVFVQIFSPKNTAQKPADLLAEEVREVFEGIHLVGNDIRFRNTTIREIGVDEGWYQLSVECEFEYTETR